MAQDNGSFEVSYGGITVRGRGNAVAAAADVKAVADDFSPAMLAQFDADEERIERLAAEYFYDRSLEQ